MKNNRTTKKITTKTISIIIVILTVLSTFVCTTATTYAATATITTGDNVQKKTLDDGSELYYAYADIGDCVYNPKKACTPDVEFEKIFIENDSEFYKLNKDEDYTLKYKNNNKVGVATISVVGINDYEDVEFLDINFNIVPDVQKTMNVPIVTTANKVVCYGQKQIKIVSSDQVEATYVSDNTQVATVDDNGVVNAVGEGKANITVTIDEKEYVCVVTVENKQLNNNNITIYTAKAPNTTTLKLTPAGTVTWKTSNSKIATVNGKGVVTAKKSGKATITGSIDGAKFKVSVKCVAPSVKKILKGNLYICNKAKIWKVSNAAKYKFTVKKNKTLSVSKNGTVCAKKKGTKNITVTAYYKGKNVWSKTLKVKVCNPSIQTKVKSLCVGQQALIKFNSGTVCKLSALKKIAKEVNVKKAGKAIRVRVKKTTKKAKTLFTVKVNGVKISFRTKLVKYTFGVKNKQKVRIGKTIQFKKVNGITLKVDNKKLATVNTNGLLKAKKAGTVKVSAKYGKTVLGTKTIIVTNPPIKEIKLTENVLKSDIKIAGKEAKKIVGIFTDTDNDVSTSFFECKCTNNIYKYVTNMGQIYSVASSNSNYAYAEIRNNGIYIVGGTTSGAATITLKNRFTSNKYKFNVVVDASTFVPETYSYASGKTAVLVDSETELINCIIDASKNYVLKGEKYKYCGVSCDAVAVRGFWRDKSYQQKEDLIYNKIEQKEPGLYDLMFMGPYCGVRDDNNDPIFNAYNKKYFVCEFNTVLGKYSYDDLGQRKPISKDFYQKIAKPVVDKANTLDTRYEKAWYIFTWVYKHMTYSTTINDGGPVGGLLATYKNGEDKMRGKGVCMDYTFLANYLCVLANIPVVSSHGLNHAWSAVKSDNNKWYFCDATVGAGATSYETATGFEYQYLFMKGYYCYYDESRQNSSYWHFEENYNISIERNNCLKYNDLYYDCNKHTIEEVTARLTEIGYIAKYS